MDHVYEKIRTLRSQKNLTLKDLSEKTGLSISFLSQVERSESSIAINSLQKIAQALGVHITQFFESPAHSNYKVTVEERKSFQIEGSNATYTRLSSEIPSRMLEPLLVSLQPGEDHHGTYSHPGEEFYYVLSGEIVVFVEEQEYRLVEGETMHFPSQLPHRSYNSGKEPAQFLCVCTPVLFQ